MKKVISLFMIVLLLLSLVACSNNDTNPTNPIPVIPEGQEPPAPTTDPNNQEPSQGATEDTTPEDPTPAGEWVTKADVTAPAVTKPVKNTESVSFGSSGSNGGASFNVNLYQAAWHDSDPNEVMQALKTLPFFEDWTWSRKQEEKAYADLFENGFIGQQTRYEHTTSLIATKQDGVAEHRVTVSFLGDTANYSGWRAISVNYSTAGSEMNAKKQEAFMPVLTVVYGDYAEYMCYAPETDSKYGEMTLYVENDIGKDMLCRRLDDNSVYFTTYSYSSLENEFEYYGGPYTSMLDGKKPEYYDDIFGKIEPVSFSDIRNVGSDFIATHLNNYAYTAPSSHGHVYTYSIQESEDGSKTVSFDMDMLVYQTNAAKIEGMNFELGYEVKVEDGKVVSLRADGRIPAASENEASSDYEDATTLKYLQDYLKHAKNVANAAFGTKYTMDEVYWNGSKDYKLWHKDTISLLGLENDIRFDFTTKAINSIGKYRSFFTFSIG